MSKEVKLSEAVNQLQNVRIVIINGNTFIIKKEGHETEDIHQELRDIANEPE